MLLISFVQDIYVYSQIVFFQNIYICFNNQYKKKNKLQNLIPGCPTRPGHPSNIQNQNLNIHSRYHKPRRPPRPGGPLTNTDQNIKIHFKSQKPSRPPRPSRPSIIQHQHSLQIS